MDAARIDVALVRALIAQQFPQWNDLRVEPVVPGGWDNRSFRLGNDLLVRMPSADVYAAQVGKEQHWLPRLAPHLPCDIPRLIAAGHPGLGYPWHWSVLAWINGEPASAGWPIDMRIFAIGLGRFLAALHAVSTEGGPLAGEHSFQRGGSLAFYDAEVRSALGVLRSRVDVSGALALWDRAREAAWNRSALWVHGDISPGNLLLREGRLCAVIDFGQLCVGDPACDLAIAWTWLNAESRQVLREALPLDEGSWLRGRAWALWKALIVAAGHTQTNAVEYRNPLRVIAEVLKDSK
ncbi:MAG: aminoglycoside phosphotransferase family protein [Betaproteobacteria bacterium]|nr:aminoglycoside phosphotransferase family protein [Betaproteobacteria bacterium]